MPKIFQSNKYVRLNQEHYSKKQYQHCVIICSDYLHIQKSSAKQSQGVKIWSLQLHLPLIFGLISSFLNPNTH